MTSFRGRSESPFSTSCFPNSLSLKYSVYHNTIFYGSMSWILLSPVWNFPKKFRSSETGLVGCSITQQPSLSGLVIGQSSKTDRSHFRRQCSRWAPTQVRLLYGVSNQVFNKRHFYGNKEKQRLMLEQSINSVFECRGQSRFLGVRCEVSTNGVRTGSGNLTDFPGFQYECLWQCHQVFWQTFWGAHSGTKFLHTWAIMVIFLKFLSSCSVSVWCALRKEQF